MTSSLSTAEFLFVLGLLETSSGCSEPVSGLFDGLAGIKTYVGGGRLFELPKLFLNALEVVIPINNY